MSTQHLVELMEQNAPAEALVAAVEQQERYDVSEVLSLLKAAMNYKPSAAKASTQAHPQEAHAQPEGAKAQPPKP
jgi:non-homologous end joining protein Ku